MPKHTYGVRENSHWQGCRPGPVLAAFATEPEAHRAEDALSTCSFCRPGRTAQYSVGRCFDVVKTSREPGYIHEDAPADLIEHITGLAS